jgi:hypothetical protein
MKINSLKHKFEININSDDRINNNITEEKSHKKPNQQQERMRMRKKFETMETFHCSFSPHPLTYGTFEH